MGCVMTVSCSSSGGVGALEEELALWQQAHERLVAADDDAAPPVRFIGTCREVCAQPINPTHRSSFLRAEEAIPGSHLLVSYH